MVFKLVVYSLASRSPFSRGKVRAVTREGARGTRLRANN